MKKQCNWVNIVKFGGAYVACAIGSGFATGQEILQFFTSHGFRGILACLFSTIFFAWFGGAVMGRACALRLKNPGDILRYFCGDRVGPVLEWATQIFLFAAFVIMISGSGATLAEHYGIKPYHGRILMAVLTLLTVMLRLNKLVDILGTLGPVIIVFSVSIGIFSLLGNIDGLLSAEETLRSLQVVNASDSWWFSGILYPAYNVVAVIIFLSGIGASAPNQTEATLGGILGGVCYAIATLFMNLGLLANIAEVSQRQVPSLYLANQISPLFGVIFSVILLAGIYTTAVPMLWAVCSKFAPEGTRKFRFIAVQMTLVALVLGLLPFGTLVNLIYPLAGYMGLAILFCILLRTFHRGSIEELRIKYNGQYRSN